MKQLRALGRSFCYAGRGILSCIKNERNMRIHLCASFYVLLLMPFYGFSRGEKAAVFLCIGLVTALEAVNTAVEAAIDLISTEKHPLAALAKDAAAGAVLLSAIGAAAVGVTLYADAEALGRIYSWFASSPIRAALFVVSVCLWAAAIFVPCVIGRKNKDGEQASSAEEQSDTKQTEITETIEETESTGMVKWTDEASRATEDPNGEFETEIFRGEDDSPLGIYLMDGVSREYGEKCAEALDSLPQKTIVEICKGIVGCAEQGGESEDFELPRLGNAKDILEYCWFTTVYAIKPKNGSVAYIVEGEGDWGEAVSFVIEDGNVVYLGADYTEYLEE